VNTKKFSTVQRRDPLLYEITDAVAMKPETNDQSYFGVASTAVCVRGRIQREAYQREITLEEHELRDDPQAEAEELAVIYRNKGLDAEEAERVATTIMKDRDAALDTMAREELGLDPDELGSPWSAALSSLGAFAAGVVVVVLPYLFSSGRAALIAAIVLASLALFAVGAVIGVLNGRGGLRSAMRQLLIGGGAALLVYVIGRGVGALTGVQLGGTYQPVSTESRTPIRWRISAARVTAGL
jgi:VIT1/CCC1 family predicted Fe2+/Mn2+ transporter